MRTDTGCVEQRGSQFGHGDVAVLAYDFGEEHAVRVQFALALRTALRCCSCPSGAPDRDPHRAPVAGDSFSRNAAARPLNPSSTNL